MRTTQYTNARSNNNMVAKVKHRAPPVTPVAGAGDGAASRRGSRWRAWLGEQSVAEGRARLSIEDRETGRVVLVCRLLALLLRLQARLLVRCGDHTLLGLLSLPKLH